MDETQEQSRERKAEEVRAQIRAVDPYLLDLLDECKRVFSARLVAIDCGPVKRGNPHDPKYVGIPASPPVLTYDEALARWQREVEEKQARDRAHRGAGYKRATRAR